MKFFHYEGVKVPVPDGVCKNCHGPAAHEHPDLCCTCFCIAFGSHEHREEHSIVQVRGSFAWHKRGAFLGYIPTFDQEAPPNEAR